MAQGLAYNTQYPELLSSYRQNVRIRINRRKKPIKAEAYESVYFLDEKMPDGKYRYYCRHSENDWDKIVSIKANLGLTVNFWGTIVTNEPINFRGKDEVSARVVWWQDDIDDNINEEE